MLELDGQSLALEEVEQAALHPELPVRLSPEARERIQESRDFVERLLEDDRVIYGVSTGFGRMAEVVISEDKRAALQKNLIRSHAAGVGPLLPDHVVRAVMILRANALSRGHSGCRIDVVQGILDLLNAGIVPRVPEMGSVGASGDLAPLAHIALALMGEGRVRVGGEERDAAEALALARLEPVELREKEGLALINGTQATTGQGILALLRAERAVETADMAGATTLEGLRGTPDAFREEVHLARPHPGQVESARRLREHMRSSEIRESHRENDPRVQDPYCLRCMPQVHGAAREALAHVRRVLRTEANSSTDNPLIFRNRTRW
jgi:histidine ammonia-lyase